LDATNGRLSSFCQLKGCKIKPLFRVAQANKLSEKKLKRLMYKLMPEFTNVLEDAQSIYVLNGVISHRVNKKCNKNNQEPQQYLAKVNYAAIFYKHVKEFEEDMGNVGKLTKGKSNIFT